MEILYIKLKNGTDIISNTSIKGNNVTLEHPMAIRQFADPRNGRVSLSFNEWVPSDFVDTSKFLITRDETLIICNTSSKIQKFYKECIKPNEESDEVSEEKVTDLHSNLIKLINNNRKLLH